MEEKVKINDKKGFTKRFIERIEDTGAYYGEYRFPPIETNRFNSILHTTRKPTREELESIAKTYECSVEWLLTGEGECKDLWE